VTFTACGRDNSPEGVAKKFLFAYFIEVNQQKALTISSGLAEKKLREELQLTRQARQLEPDFSQSRPHIDYTLLESHPRSPDRVMYLYELTIRGKGSGEAFHSRILLSVVNDNGVWKVNNYEYMQEGATTK